MLASVACWEDNPARGAGVTRRTWLVFCAIQLLGILLGNLARLLGLTDTQSPFVMFPVLAGWVLLLPGFAVAVALNNIPNRVPAPIVRFLVSFPGMVACNAIFWFACSAVWRIWRKLRSKHQA